MIWIRINKIICWIQEGLTICRFERKRFLGTHWRQPSSPKRSVLRTLDPEGTIFKKRRKSKKKIRMMIWTILGSSTIITTTISKKWGFKGNRQSSQAAQLPTRTIIWWSKYPIIRSRWWTNHRLISSLCAKEACRDSRASLIKVKSRYKRLQTCLNLWHQVVTVTTSIACSSPLLETKS